MSMLLQQIRRATYSRRATAAALTPPLTFSRFYSTNNRVLVPEKEGTVWGAFLKNGSAIAFMFGTFYVVDYGGYSKASDEAEKQLKELRKRSAEQKRLDEKYIEESKAFDEAKKQLKELSKAFDEAKKQLKELRGMQRTMADN